MEKTFQERVLPWMLECFGVAISQDRKERNHRFFEEAAEMVQAGGMSKEDAMILIDYVYGRPAGEIEQEVGGVMVTLAAWCLAHDIDMHECGDIELERIWTKVESIREKQKTKPHGALPQAVALPRPPAAMSRWQHKKGGFYMVTQVTNLSCTRPGWVPTVSYMCMETGELYSRPLAEWTPDRYTPANY